jgi:DNA-binding response OmpR family regulator
MGDFLDRDGMRILVVEDDELVAEAVARGLRAAGFAVDRVASAEQAYVACAGASYEAMVIDIGLPGDDGLALVTRLRRDGKSMPVIMLTARQAVDDKLRAFDLGADDFLVKPFEQAELTARCRALIRRANLEASGRTTIGRLKVDLYGKRLTIDECDVVLTAREWAVLDYLVRHPGRIVSKDRLMEALTSWDQNITANAVEVHVSRLRSKLGDGAVIRNLRGLGYRLEEPTSDGALG